MSLLGRVISFDVQLTPTVTEFKAPIICICYRRISVIANKGNNKNFLKNCRKFLLCRRISITGGSVLAGFIFIPPTPIEKQH